MLIERSLALDVRSLTWVNLEVIFVAQRFPGELRVHRFAVSGSVVLSSLMHNSVIQGTIGIFVWRVTAPGIRVLR
jgi:hypothetical protein